MKSPNGYAEIVRTYGDPKPYVKPDGTMRDSWEMHTLGVAYLPDLLPLGWDLTKEVHRIRCHLLLVPIVTATFQGIHAAGLWGELHTFDGCYAPRAQRGASGKPSLHLWGAAIDLNAGTNQLGEPGDMSQAIVALFEAHGWTWGGHFSRPDPMHFQMATGY